MTDTNKNVVRRLLEEVFNNNNLTVADELVATNYVYREPTVGEKRGREGFRDLITTYKTAFPDAAITINEQIAEGDRVVTRWTATGTHRGELFGTAPTNRHVTVQGVIVSRVTNGKVTEEYEVFDTLGMLRQIGAVPTTLKVAA
jgi:steroid delta-isomerase-like uncharacterized protein